MAQFFRQYRIPFLYESPLLVFDRGRYRIWHPDFTLPGFDGLVVEYAGMPDIPDYMAGIRRKQNVFRSHRIPAVFIYPSETQRSGWRYHVLGRIHDAYQTYQWRKCWAHVLEAPIVRKPSGRSVPSRYIQPSH